MKRLPLHYTLTVLGTALILSYFITRWRYIGLLISGLFISLWGCIWMNLVLFRTYRRNERHDYDTRVQDHQLYRSILIGIRDDIHYYPPYTTVPSEPHRALLVYPPMIREEEINEDVTMTTTMTEPDTSSTVEHDLPSNVPPNDTITIGRHPIGSTTIVSNPLRTVQNSFSPTSSVSIHRNADTKDEDDDDEEEGDPVAIHITDTEEPSVAIQSSLSPTSPSVSPSTPNSSLLTSSFTTSTLTRATLTDCLKLETYLRNRILYFRCYSGLSSDYVLFLQYVANPRILPIHLSSSSSSTATVSSSPRATDLYPSFSESTVPSLASFPSPSSACPVSLMTHDDHYRQTRAKIEYPVPQRKKQNIFNLLVSLHDSCVAYNNALLLCEYDPNVWLQILWGPIRLKKLIHYCIFPVYKHNRYRWTPRFQKLTGDILTCLDTTIDYLRHQRIERDPQEFVRMYREYNRPDACTVDTIAQRYNFFPTVIRQYHSVYADILQQYTLTVPPVDMRTTRIEQVQDRIDSTIAKSAEQGLEYCSALLCCTKPSSVVIARP